MITGSSDLAICPHSPSAPARDPAGLSRSKAKRFPSGGPLVCAVPDVPDRGRFLKNICAAPEFAEGPKNGVKCDHIPRYSCAAARAASYGQPGPWPLSKDQAQRLGGRRPPIEGHRRDQMKDDIVIVSAARTPVGAFNGALGGLPAHELGKVAIQEALKRAGVESGRVSEVIIAQILTAGQGQNPARQASIAAGIPVESPAWGVNQLCGSGLRAVALGYQAIMNGDRDIVVAGGQESMSMAPHAAYLRAGQKMGSLEMVDTMIKDGLWDAFNGYHMGTTAENVATKYQITRSQQDEFATASQNKAEVAQKAGKFKDEIVAVTIKGRKGDIVVDTDEYPKAGVTVEGIAKLRPAFSRDGTVTAANASGINDGAAAVVLMSAKQAAAEGKKPLARIVSWAHAGVDPSIMGTGPIPASRAALKKAGWDTSKVNVNGGAIAIGHPIGASGARVLVTLLHEMQKRDAKKGLATLCIGGGMGIAMCVERG